MNEFVIDYLNKRGYIVSVNSTDSHKQNNNDINLKAFESGLSADPNDYNSIRRFRLEENSAEVYESSFNYLKSFIENSLDDYYNELCPVIYPVFIHFYLDLIEHGFFQEAKKFLLTNQMIIDERYQDEIQSISHITKPEHIQDNEIAQKYRLLRVEILLSSYSYHILISFIEDAQLMILLKTINEHISFTIISRKPLHKPERFDQNKEVGDKNETRNSKSENKYDSRKRFNVDKSHTRASIISIDENMLKVRELNSSNIRQGILSDVHSLTSNNDNSTFENRKSSIFQSYQGTLKDEASNQSLIKLETSKIPLPKITDKTKKQIRDNFSKRFKLSRNNLPSICMYTFLNSINTISSIEISSSGQLVAAGTSDSTLLLWDLVSERHLNRLQRRHRLTEQDFEQSDEKNNEFNRKNEDQILNMDSEFSGNLGNDEKMFENVKDKYCRRSELIGHQGPVFASSFSPCESYLLSCSEDCSIRLQNVKYKQCWVCYQGHNQPVQDVTFSRFGFYFASASNDKTACLQSTNRIIPLRIFVGHLSDVDCVKFHPNCNYLATGSSDCSLRLQDIQMGNCVRIFTGHQSKINALSFSPDGRFLSSASDDKTVRIYDIASGRIFSTLESHSKAVTCLSQANNLSNNDDDLSFPVPKVGNDGMQLASGSSDSTVKIQNINNSVSANYETQKQSENKSNEINNCSLIKTFQTKQTPLSNLSWTPTNLLICAGKFYKNN